MCSNSSTLLPELAGRRGSDLRAIPRPGHLVEALRRPAELLTRLPRARSSQAQHPPPEDSGLEDAGTGLGGATVQPLHPTRCCVDRLNLRQLPLPQAARRPDVPVSGHDRQAAEARSGPAACSTRPAGGRDRSIAQLQALRSRGRLTSTRAEDHHAGGHEGSCRPEADPRTVAARADHRRIGSACTPCTYGRRRSTGSSTSCGTRRCPTDVTRTCTSPEVAPLEHSGTNSWGRGEHGGD